MLARARARRHNSHTRSHATAPGPTWLCLTSAACCFIFPTHTPSRLRPPALISMCPRPAEHDSKQVELCDELARQGFVAVAPDTFNGQSTGWCACAPSFRDLSSSFPSL